LIPSPNDASRPPSASIEETQGELHALLRNQMMRETSFEKFCDNLAWLYESPFETRAVH
jgi:hypothetical protein